MNAANSDPATWIRSLRARVHDWKSSPTFRLCFFEIAEPETQKTSPDGDGRTTFSLPGDLEKFYRAGAAQCRVVFYVTLKGNRSVYGGLTIAPRSSLLGLTAGLKEVIDDLSRHKLRAREKVEAIINHGIVFSESDANFLIYVTANEIILPGVYLMGFETLLEQEPAVRLSPTFAAWLEFLDRACYLGPQFGATEQWVQDGQLARNHDMISEVEECLGCSPEGNSHITG